MCQNKWFQENIAIDRHADMQYVVFYFQLRCGANIGIAQNRGALSQLDKRTTGEISYLSLGVIRSGEGLINLAHPLQDSIRENRTQIVWPRPAATAHHAENDSICIAWIMPVTDPCVLTPCTKYSCLSALNRTWRSRLCGWSQARVVMSWQGANCS